jgi:ATP-binding cassette, subfamily B, multidrug efflux pump
MRYLTRLIPYIRGSRRLLITVLILAVLGQTAALVIPQVILQIVQDALAHHPGHIAPWAILILMLAVIRAALAGFETLLGIRLGQQVLCALRQDIFAHLCRLRIRFFDQTRSGELLSRITADLEPIDGFFSWGARMIVRNLLLFIGVLVICLSTNARLTLFSIAIVPLITITAFTLGNLIRPAWQAARERVGDFSSALEETLSGIRVVKMSVQEERETEKLTRASEEVRKKTWLANRIDAAYFPLTGFWAGIAGLMILAYGGSQVIHHHLTLPQYVAFEVYLMLLLTPMRMLGWMVSALQRAAVGARRVFELMEEVPEEISLEEAPAATLTPTLSGEVVFENITFGYREDEPILHNVSFRVEAGEIVGILGATGSGKSALMALLPRLYDPRQGRVMLDGQDMKQYDLTWLRRQIGLVFQEPFLFSATIKENIALGRPEASQEDIELAAKRAALHDFIMSLEEGYDTLVGERGLNLSGGQQQRLALARTLLIDPAILILDNATSSVDADTEFEIQQALNEVMRGRTTFIISQRAYSVASAHRIVVLEKGNIVEQGAPEELARLPGGHYRKLLEVQESLGVNYQ